MWITKGFELLLVKKQKFEQDKVSQSENQALVETSKIIKYMLAGKIK